MDGRYGYKTAVSIWDQTQVLGYEVKRYESLCQYSKRKVKDLWMHDYAW